MNPPRSLTTSGGSFGANSAGFVTHQWCSNIVLAARAVSMIEVVSKLLSSSFLVTPGLCKYVIGTADRGAQASCWGSNARSAGSCTARQPARRQQWRLGERQWRRCGRRMTRSCRERRYSRRTLARTNEHTKRGSRISDFLSRAEKASNGSEAATISGAYSGFLGFCESICGWQGLSTDAQRAGRRVGQRAEAWGHTSSREASAASAASAV